MTRSKPAARSKLTDRALDEVLPHWGVLVLESHHSPQFTMDWREHDFLKFVFVLRGRGVLEFKDGVHRFEKGDLLVVQPNTPNRITDAPGAASSLYICCVDKKHLGFDDQLLATLPQGLIPGSAYLSNRVAIELRRMRHHQAKQSCTRPIALVSSALRLTEWILQLGDAPTGSARLRSHVTGDREVMDDYVSRLQTEFYEASTIEAASASIGMSRRTFTKLFQDVTGSTWLNYVRKLAINHAKHQLAQTNLPIASVAFECGFNDLSTFYRQFKTQVGMSPKAYRKSISMPEQSP